MARTSADKQYRDILLFTMGEKKLVKRCGLSQEIARIISQNGLTVLIEETTDGNRDSVYVGFELASGSCSPDTLKQVLDDVMQAVDACSREVGRLL